MVKREREEERGVGGGGLVEGRGGNIKKVEGGGTVTSTAVT